MRTILFLLLLSSVCYTYGQSFEGRIVYRLSIESSDPKRISSQQIEMMFKDADTTAILYLKGNRYKLVTLDHKTKKVKTVNQYDPVSNKIYDYVLVDSTKNPFVMQTNNTSSQIPYKRHRIKNEELIILGQECNGIILNYGSGYTKLYFSDKYNLNTESISENAPSFLNYVKKCESLPLKIVISGNGAVHNLIFEATEIIQEVVDEKIFGLPN